ncbi:MAG: UPF0149 family protein [Burkholderiales bacterium]
MGKAMDLTDAEIGELDDLLAAIPAPLESLDVVALDGYLCGLLAQPVMLPPQAWLPGIADWNWGEPDVAPLSAETPGWHAAKHERLCALVQRRLDAIDQAIIDDGWFDPLVVEPEDDEGRPLTGREGLEAALGPWVMGFEHAQNHFLQLQELGRPEVPDLLACLFRHLPAQSDDERAYSQALDLEHPLRTLDAALEDLVANVVELADLARAERVRVATVRRDAPKVGRNDPCPCGSGRKFKLCHGRTGTVH